MPPEVVNRGLDRLAGLRVRADRVDVVGDGFERPVRGNQSVVLAEVADDHRHLLTHHRLSRPSLY
jgi:hypothetical protein